MLCFFEKHDAKLFEEVKKIANPDVLRVFQKV